MGVNEYKISTIVDEREYANTIKQGVNEYKISTIVDLGQANIRTQIGVNEYKISSIVCTPRYNVINTILKASVSNPPICPPDLKGASKADLIVSRDPNVFSLL